MSRFVQLHFLTSYPVSNPNRDDQGRPKSATFGNVPRLRISSQAIKRAARLSDAMQNSLKGNLGDRTQRIGDEVFAALTEEGQDEGKAKKAAKAVTEVFGKFDEAAQKEKGVLRTRQLAFISPQERQTALELARDLIDGKDLPKGKELNKMVLRTADGAADIAMFGRMLADEPGFNREAAVQVSHALTTHRALVEDDYYTAADDLKDPSEDKGAGFVGEAGYGSGVFYLYACIDTKLLAENLDGDVELAARAAGALVEAMATATPSGKRAAFAHHTLASYIRAEKGNHQPRSLAGAFLRPVQGEDVMGGSIKALEEMAGKLDTVYGNCYDGEPCTMNAEKPEGSLKDIREFVMAAVKGEAS